MDKIQPSDDDFVFRASQIRKKDHPNPHWSEDFVTRKFTHYRDKAGFPKGVVLHSTRHSFTTHLGDSGVHGEHLQTLLQHASRSTTDIYNHSKDQLIPHIGILDVLEIDQAAEE